MTNVRVVIARVFGLFRGVQRDADLDDEIQDHLDLLAEEHRQRGASREDARMAARRAFGGIEQAKEIYRDQSSVPFLEECLQDCAYSIRLMRKNKGLAAAVILTLGLSIGATTALFSVVEAVLLRPLAYPDPERLVVIEETLPAAGHIPVNAMHFAAWRMDTDVFAQMALIGPLSPTLTGSGDPEQLAGARASSNLFSMLGVAMQLGRAFTSDEEQPGRNQVVILDDALWRQRFGADPNVIGRRITLDGESYEVVGILPRNFRFPSLRQLISVPTTLLRPEVWTPFRIRESDRVLLGEFNNICLARLKPGATVAQARLEIEQDQVSLRTRMPQDVELHAAVLSLKGQIVGRSKLGLELLLAAIATVLMIGCLNLTSLLLIGVIGRDRELGVRRALGATRARIIRQIVTESIALCTLGGLIAVGVAYVGIRFIVSVMPSDVPRLDEIILSGRVLVLTFVLSSIVGALIGLLPALRSTETSLASVMSVRRDTTVGRKTGRSRSWLVITEIALSTVCLMIAGQLLHSFVNLLNVDKGFNSEHVATATLNTWGFHSLSTEERDYFWRTLLERIAAAPGVSAVAVANQLPLTGVGSTEALTLAGTSLSAVEGPMADIRVVNPDFFHTWEIPVKTGRIFGDSDRARRVTVVSAFTAQHLWPNEDPVGKQLRFGTDPKAPPYQVIGVVGDSRTVTLDQAPAFAAYVPYWQPGSEASSIAVRTRSNTSAISSTIREEVKKLNPNVALVSVETMDDIVARATSERRVQMNLALLFAGTAVFLAGLGLYGVLSYAVAQRTKEIGIRMALGATPSAARGLVVRDAALLLASGLACGVPTSFIAASSLGALLFGVRPFDVVTALGVCAAIMSVALTASYLPARRASRVNPSNALKWD